MTAAFPIGTSPPNPRTGWPLRVVAAVVAMLVVGVGIGATAAAEPTAPPPPPPVATTPQQPAPTAPTPTPPPTSQGPSTPATPSPTPRGSWPGDSSQVPVEPSDTGDSDCGIRNISGCVANAIDGFFARLVDSALNPLLELLSQTLLTTPEPGDLPRVGELWDSSWHLMLAMYGLLVVAAGILLMVRETLQTRWSLQELLPRIVVGFIAGAMSMLLATQAIVFANALAEAFAGSGVESDSATTALKELTGSVTGNGIFLVLLRTALVVMLVVLLITYVVRVAITIILIVAAPLALMCHALPGLDSIARWWWRSFAACLAIQVVQSLVLVTTLRVFLTPGGWGFFGPNMDGVVSLIIGLALMGVLIKIPFWLMSTMRIGHGRSMVGSLVRGYVAYKTFGLLKSGEKAAATAIRRPTPQGNAATANRVGNGRRGAAAAVGSADPYARTRSTRDGQLMLPLEGVHRVRRTQGPATPPSQSATTTSAPASPGTAPGPTTRPRSRGRQLAFDFTPPDPYSGIRANHRGQYPLPIPVARVRRTPAPAGPPAAPAPASASPPPRPRQGTQLAFEFDPPDPYEGNRRRRRGPNTRAEPPAPRRPARRPRPPPLWRVLPRYFRRIPRRVARKITPPATAPACPGQTCV